MSERGGGSGDGPPGHGKPWPPRPGAENDRGRPSSPAPYQGPTGQPGAPQPPARPYAPQPPPPHGGQPYAPPPGPPPHQPGQPAPPPGPLPQQPRQPYAPQPPHSQPYAPQPPGAHPPGAPPQQPPYGAPAPHGQPPLPRPYPASPQPHAAQPYPPHAPSHQPPPGQQAAPLPPPPHHMAPGGRQPPAPYRREHPAPFPPVQDGAATMKVWQDPAWAAHGPPPGDRAAVLPPLSPAESALLAAPPSAMGTLKLAVRRAFRLYIDPREVTDAERAALESQAPPITDPDVQGFLAWRRSVHLVVAVAILPLLLFQVLNLAKSGNNPPALNALLVLHLLIDVGFAILLWTQLGRWTQWQKQRRVLLIGWLAFFLMPFVLYLYPLRSAMDDELARQAGGDPRVVQLGSMVIGMVASIAAMIELAPKAISLMPGLLRGALTSKLLFPGASGPGWLVLLLSPIYALLLYVVLIVPYQLTGSGFFVPAMIGLIGAQIWMGRAGYQLARPENLDEALVLVRKVRGTYVALNLIGLVFVAFGVAATLRELQLPVWQGLRVLLSLLVNVLLLTLIATDQIVANLVRAQKLLRQPGTGGAQEAFARDIAHFDEAEPPSPGQEPHPPPPAHPPRPI